MRWRSRRYGRSASSQISLSEIWRVTHCGPELTRACRFWRNAPLQRGCGPRPIGSNWNSSIDGNWRQFGVPARRMWTNLERDLPQVPDSHERGEGAHLSQATEMEVPRLRQGPDAAAALMQAQRYFV